LLFFRRFAALRCQIGAAVPKPAWTLSRCNRTPDGKGMFSEATLALLYNRNTGSAFDMNCASQRVLTLDEVFALVEARGTDQTLLAASTRIHDCKVEADVVAFTEKHVVLPRLVVIGTTINSSAVRRRFHAADHVDRGAGANSGRSSCRPSRPRRAGPRPLRFVPTAKQVSQANQAGKKVLAVDLAATGRKPDNWQKVREAGVDAMRTDHPLERRQRWRQKR
jgi:glycerophosphoryl diester phosphodiesterase